MITCIVRNNNLLQDNYTNQLQTIVNPSKKLQKLLFFILDCKDRKSYKILISYSSLIIICMSEETEKKQQYLCEEILEAGFDAEDFLEYMNQSKIGEKIEQITIQQLKRVVQDYRKNKLEESIHVTKPCKHVGFDTNSMLKEEKKQAKKIYFEKYEVEQPEFKKTFKCRKLRQEKILKVTPKIEVSNPERKTAGGLFGIGGTSFLLFEIDTLDNKWKVKRRYSDFIWLRNTVSKFFPTHIIPPIPRKKASKRSTRDVQKRMTILKYFLNDLAGYPQIFSSKYVQGFLNITNNDEFQKLKKQGSSTQAFQTITSLQTTDGEVQVCLSNQQKVFKQQISTYLSGAQNLYKSINKNARSLQLSFIDQTNILYAMGNQFADLYQLVKPFNDKLPQFEQSSMSDTYITLNNMLIQWGNIVHNQYAFVEKNFLPFFRYIRNQIYSFQELSLKVQHLQQEYFKTRTVLDKRKQKIFQQKDVSKWDIPDKDITSIPSTVIKNRCQAFQFMLPRQTFELDKLRLNYAFYMSQFKDHALGFLQNKAKRFVDNFKQFAINMKVNTQQIGGLWNQVATNFADPVRQLSIMNPAVLNKKDQQDIFEDD